MSSAIFAVCGSSSLNHMPLCPCCANLNTDGAIGKFVWYAVMPVSRCPLRMESGRFNAATVFQGRLVVEHVHLRRRAVLEEVNDALGFWGEVRQPGQCRVGAQILSEQRGQSRFTDAGRRPAEEMAACDQQLAFVMGSELIGS